MERLPTLLLALSITLLAAAIAFVYRPPMVVCMTPAAPAPTPQRNVQGFVPQFILPQPVWPRRNPPQPNNPPETPMAATSSSAHGCVVFGGQGPSTCQSFPNWQTGIWRLTSDTATVHVLVVGGGGGGAASIERGIGGAGGASGEVVSTNVTMGAAPVMVQVGQPGQGGQNFLQPGADGGASSFGSTQAVGGEGGQTHQGGSTNVANGGSSGGGGAGGGNYDGANFQGGGGGAGGTDGGNGKGGQPGGSTDNGVMGLPAGMGTAFPALTFKDTAITPGRGGAGGAYGLGADNPPGYGGAGGGGGGGVNAGPSSPSGSTGIGGDNGLAQGGQGGAGFGAGGGGGGNIRVGTPGGNGAPGLVYVEW